MASEIVFLAALVICAASVQVIKSETVLRGDHNAAIKSACGGTLYPDLCISTVSVHPLLMQGASSKDFSRIALKRSTTEAEKVFGLVSRLRRWAALNRVQRGAIEDCIELFDLTLDDLDKSLSNVTNSGATYFKWRQAADVQTWLSAALTNQATCLDGLENAGGSTIVKSVVRSSVHNVSRLVSNSLAIVKNVSVVGNNGTSALINSRSPGHNRRLLSDPSTDRKYKMKSHKVMDDEVFMSHYGSTDEGVPSWLSAADRRLLLTTGDDSIEADSVVTVAKDGSGNYTTITDAVIAAPNKSDDRYVIYVTAGVYQEYIEIPKSKTNLMLIGDGMDVTVITGNRSVVDGWTTFRSATFAAVGQGFLARDITFENTAGPEKHQAVALRVGSDLSAFYRCRIKGYQDTLYAHSLRQFYRECTISGTVDFIFGNAAVVFQSCTLLARKPMDNQKNVFTAQGRDDPNQNTGISIQNCTVTADSDLIPVKSSFPTYLGRPWKQYSRTVYMQSYLDDLIVPAGWLEWSGDFALSTLYYGEYMNSGPGAGTANRVVWPGYHGTMNISDATNFTVAEFISGNSWLTSSSVPYDAGF